MAKDPAFLFYTNDFISGTQFFTDEQVGIYIRLLAAQHQHGHLSENHMKMICKSYDNDIFSKFIKDSDGKYYNERLEIEIVKRKKYAESRGNNKRGKKIISKSYDNHMENENENKDIDLNKNKGEDLKKIPSLLDFTSYALEQEPLLEIQSIKLKYESWKVAGWKAGKDLKPIKNWKTTLLNTIPYLTKNNTQPTISKNEERFNKFQAEADGAAAIIRAKYGIEKDS